MTRYRMCVCGESVLDLDRGHPERCRGPRLRQPVYRPWDWAVLMADQDQNDLRGTGGHAYGTDDGGGVPWERRH